MSTQAKLELEGKSYSLPVVIGSEGEKAVDVSALRAKFIAPLHVTVVDVIRGKLFDV